MSVLATDRLIVQSTKTALKIPRNKSQDVKETQLNGHFIARMLSLARQGFLLCPLHIFPKAWSNENWVLIKSLNISPSSETDMNGRRPISKSTQCRCPLQLAQSDVNKISKYEKNPQVAVKNSHLKNFIEPQLLSMSMNFCFPPWRFFSDWWKLHLFYTL